MLSHTMAEKPFEAAMMGAQDILYALSGQIAILQHELKQSRAMEDTLISELEALANSAIRALRRASQSAVPETVPRLGGRHVLKVGLDLGKMPVDARREFIRQWLRSQIDIKRTPEKGHRIASEILQALVAGQGRDTLGLEILKPTDAGAVEYVPVAAMAASGGETLTAALLLWVVLTRLRAETMANSKLALGGALILDNPIGKANHQLFLRTQRAIAHNLGVQLIFTTGVEDLNAIAEFPHVLKFGKEGERNGRIVVRVASEHLGEPRDGADGLDQGDLFAKAG